MQSRHSSFRFPYIEQYSTKGPFQKLVTRLRQDRTSGLCLMAAVKVQFNPDWTYQEPFWSLRVRKLKRGFFFFVFFSEKMYFFAIIEDSFSEWSADRYCKNDPWEIFPSKASDLLEKKLHYFSCTQHESTHEWPKK